MKRFFMILMLICTMFAGTAYADTIEPTVIVADESAPAANTTNIRYAKTNLNIRKEPSLNGEIVHTLKRNDKVFKVRDIDETWTEIICEDENGISVMY